MIELFSDMISTPFSRGVVFAYFGLIIGSMLNMLSYRLPLIWGYTLKGFNSHHSLMNRSHCPKCDHVIAWYDNIPIFSYLALGGRCRHCDTAIPKEYLLTELFTGIIFAVLSIISPNWDLLLFSIDAVIFSLLILIAKIDIAIYKIPNKLSAFLFVALLVRSVFSGPDGYLMFIVSASIGYFIIQLVLFCLRWIRGREKVVFGAGDVKFMAILSGGVGLSLSMSFFVLSCLIFLVFAIAPKASRNQEIPFAPSLGLAFMVFYISRDIQSMQPFLDFLRL